MKERNFTIKNQFPLLAQAPYAFSPQKGKKEKKEEEAPYASR